MMKLLLVLKLLASVLSVQALPSECHFPFEYDGIIYTSCTLKDSTDGNPWCSRTTAYEGNRHTCDLVSLCTSDVEFVEIPGNCTYFYTCLESGGISLTKCANGTVFDVFSGGCDFPHNTTLSCNISEETMTSSGHNSAIINGNFSGEGGILESHQVCSVWSNENVYTFDEFLYTLNGRCGYLLVHDCNANNFNISLTHSEYQHAVWTISYGSEILILTNGTAVHNSKKIEIPSFLNTLRVFGIPNTDYIVVYIDDNKWISWDGEDKFSMFMDQQRWSGKVCGLCGNMNGDPLDDMTLRYSNSPAADLQTFTSSWALNDTCASEESLDYCGFLTSELLQEATSACSEMVVSLSIGNCSVSTNVLETVCLQSLCQCTLNDFQKCMCEAVTSYSRLCVERGAHLEEWRTENFCPKTCPNNLIYLECGTVCHSTCQNKNENFFCPIQCLDGCFCPSGLHLDGDTCVAEDHCSCTYNNLTFASGTRRADSCQECFCEGGGWTCTPLPCVGECAAIGDPHYRTFDGLEYQFNGDCQYVFSTDACNGTSNYTFSIIGENVKCGTENEGTCTKSAMILLKTHLTTTKYHLKQDGVVAVNGSDTSLPYVHDNVIISNTSSIIIVLKTTSGLEIEWDGKMRLYVKLESEWRNKVCGLCGNFNSKSNDDMKNPQNIVETNIGNFGNSWKVNPECADAECHRNHILPESCIASEDKLTYAAEVCQIIKSNVFEPCHDYVSWEKFYYNCRNDVCECGDDQDCSCEVLADYARACVVQNVRIEWRNATVCPASCPQNMEYRECAGYCGTTCKSIGHVQEVCNMSCHPGCICHDGFYLTEQNTCVEIERCGCYFEGEVYEVNSTLVKDSVTCNCAKGVMSCKINQESITCNIDEVYVDCSTLSKGSLGVACVPSCRNPRLFCLSTTSQCVSGCACPDGMIKDKVLNKCVKPEECSCSYNEKTYQSGEKSQPDTCNECTCMGGQWLCTEKTCPAECSSIGDPHFTTFDGKTFDFQGACSYVLVEDTCADKLDGSFRVIIETMPCGNSGVTCTKAVTFYLYDQKIRLSKEHETEVIGETVNEELPHAPAGVTYSIKKGSIYYIVQTSIGIDLLWHANNFVKVLIQPHFKSKVCGLCGNYDGDMSNDFQTRSGKVEANSNLFANNWKVQNTCPNATYTSHPCELDPSRAPYAEKMCNILNSKVFEACHNKVDPRQYYDNCFYDTCGCNIGGDCECYCTAVAAYAQACAAAGVCAVWRSNYVCPVMCETYNPIDHASNVTSDLSSGSAGEDMYEWKYEACGNPCPSSCNDGNSSFCPWKRLEGCYICKEGELWDNEANKCISENDCPEQISVISTATMTLPSVTSITSGEIIQTLTNSDTYPSTSVTTTQNVVENEATYSAGVSTTHTFTKQEPVTLELITKASSKTIASIIVTATLSTHEPCGCTDSNNTTHASGETWPLRGDESMCVDLTCVEETPGVCKAETNDKRILCTKSNKPICENRFEPIAIERGCQCMWKCQCYCFGQGDPHYFTFDGLYYPFQGNCTFVLSRDTNARQSNFPHEYEIWMDNIVCEEVPKTTCTKKITVRYNSTNLVLYKNYTYSVNGEKLLHRNSLPRNINGIYLEMRGTTLFHVTIPDIDLRLTFTGVDYSWSLKLSPSRYSNRTEGLCGVCNNDQSDDLTNRSGIDLAVSDVQDFASSWLVYEESQSCFKEQQECTQSKASECEIILSDVFKVCHQLVDPQQYYDICVYDTSRCGNYSYCEALYGYSRTCDHAGACVNWRSDNVCPITCPSNRIYEACKPNCERQCSHFLEDVQCEADEAVEGCFCPRDTVEVDGECVETSTCTNCVDIDHIVYGYGDSWLHPNSSCEICSCMENKNIHCSEKKCLNGTNHIPDCSSCFVPEVVRGSDPCCPMYKCVCNYILDAGEDSCGAVVIPECAVGYIPVQTNPRECIPEYKCQCNTTKSPCHEPPTCGDLEHLITSVGECCPTYSCECNECVHDTASCSICQETVVIFDACGCQHVSCRLRNVCSDGEVLHPVNSTWQPNACTQCNCSEEMDPRTLCYIPTCISETCDTTCPVCHAYIAVKDQCCGSCVQTRCHITNENGTSYCAQAGEIWTDTTNCTEYTCSSNGNDSLTVVESDYKCLTPAIPACPICQKLESFIINCCTNFRCVPEEICCSNNIGKQVGISWSPNACETCFCTEEKNETSGFYIEQCIYNPCPPIDKEACTQNGGIIASTDDGCCMKCQASECYECGRKVSTSPENIVIEDECASTLPIAISYCNGFCLGSYFGYLSTEGISSQCSCCHPTNTVTQSVTLSCKNGSEIEYQYEDVVSCGCSATCIPKVQTRLEMPANATLLPKTRTDQMEISGTDSGNSKDTSGSATTPSSTEPISSTFSCYWSEWMNSDRPKAPHLDDNETYSHIRQSGIEMCTRPIDIECREAISEIFQHSIEPWHQITTCDVSEGFLCLSAKQIMHPICSDHEIRVYCCEPALRKENEKMN